MSDTVLLLGPVVFQDFEIPERINFGGAQRMAVHQLPGGARVIDTLGRDDAEISFSGTFSGGNATLRARNMDELRALGIALPLTWDVFTYSVIIKDFQAAYTRPGWIPFRITCIVLRDEAAALIETPLALSGALLGDFTVATALTAGLGIAAISAALSSGNTTLTEPNATRRGSRAYADATIQTDTARDRIGASITAEEITMGTDALTTTSGFGDEIGTLGRLVLLTTANAHIGRAAANLANAAN